MKCSSTLSILRFCICWSIYIFMEWKRGLLVSLKISGLVPWILGFYELGSSDPTSMLHAAPQPWMGPRLIGMHFLHMHHWTRAAMRCPSRGTLCLGELSCFTVYHHTQRGPGSFLTWPGEHQASRQPPSEKIRIMLVVFRPCLAIFATASALIGPWKLRARLRSVGSRCTAAVVELLSDSDDLMT